MSFLKTSKVRIASCLLWCLSWPVLAVIMLTPLPFGFISRSDLVGHFLLFGVMTVSSVLFARTRAQILVLAILTVVCSIALEIAQGYVPHRTFDVADAIANTTGGIAGCLAALLILKTWVVPAKRLVQV